MRGASVKEFFTLQQAGLQRGRVSEPDRLARLLSLGNQQRRAAEALWSAEYAAEALHLIQHAMATAADAAKCVVQATRGSANDGVAAALEAVEVQDAPVAAADVHRIIGATLPDLSREVQPAHARLFRDAIRLHARISDAIAYATLTPALRQRRKVARWIGCAGIVLAAGLGIYVAHRVLTAPGVKASAVYGNDPVYGPERATDGNPATEWLL